MSYRVTIEHVTETEYPEKELVWLDAEGRETDVYSKRSKSIDKLTGRILKRTDKKEIYNQDVEVIDLKAIINAVNKM